MRLATVQDDTSVEVRRIDGNGRAPIIGFLPWKTPFRLASALSLIPRDYLACYEMPSGIVSSEPEIGVIACRRMLDDALAMIARSEVDPRHVTIIGLSIGNAPATLLASRIGARLVSIASADRGDLLLWESPGSRHIKARAIGKGYQLDDFTAAMQGYNPVENLGGLAAGSSFLFGSRDELIPKVRRDGLMTALNGEAGRHNIASIDAGHAATLVKGVSKLVLAHAIRSCRLNAESTHHHDIGVGRSFFASGRSAGSAR